MAITDYPAPITHSHENIAGEGRLEGRQRAQQRRLTDAVLSQQTCQLTTVDGSIEMAGHHLLVAFCFVAYAEVL